MSIRHRLAFSCFLNTNGVCLELTSTSHWPALNVMIGAIGIVTDVDFEGYRMVKGL